MSRYAAHGRPVYEATERRGQPAMRVVATAMGTSEAQRLADALEFAGPTGQWLAMTPEAVIEHFDGEAAGEELAGVYVDGPQRSKDACEALLVENGLILRAFGEACVDIYRALTGKEYVAEEVAQR